VSLSWRVFAVNATVLVLSGAVAVAVFSPGTISSPVATKELLIVVGSLVVMLAVNRLLLARELAPLERVTAAMRRADPLARERVSVPDRPSEASELAVAFNAMAERLGTSAARVPDVHWAPRRASGCGSPASFTTRSARG
jgi:two-component system sensor histidine kinase UhpB